MRYRTGQRLALFVGVFGVAVYLGCAVPMPCTITPVNIEEIRSDIRDLERDLAEKKGVLAKLEAEIAELDSVVANRQMRIPLMEATLDSVRKASGVTFGSGTDSTAAATGSES